MRPLVYATVMATALALPQTASACHQLSENIWMCAGDTAWSDAKWDPYGDGATLLLDDYILNFTEDWPGSEIKDELTTLQEQFVTYSELVEADGNAPLAVKQQDVLELPAGKAFRSLQRDRYDDVETVSAVMLAEVADARIMLWLDGPRNLEWDSIDAESYAVLTMLREACVDETTCASPDQTRVATE